MQFPAATVKHNSHDNHKTRFLFVFYSHPAATMLTLDQFSGDCPTCQIKVTQHVNPFDPRRVLTMFSP